MRLSSIRYIYEARLGARAVFVQEGFAILGIAVGVALLFASQVSSTSLTRGVAQFNSQLVGSAQVQLKARGVEGVSERLLHEVRQAPGVKVALPVLERQVNLLGPHGERSVDLLGVEPRSVEASGPFLRRFSAHQLSSVQAIALPLPLAHEIGVRPLEVIRLQVGARFVETLVGATLEEADIGELAHSPVAVTSIRYAQQITAAPGRLTRIFVRYQPSRASEARSALAEIARKWNVNLQPSTFELRVFAVAVAPENKSEQLFSGISALVGFMFALNAMLITVPSRRKLIENLRPHGATRLMTVQILLVDAIVLGVIACALGLALGDLLSIEVFHSTPGYLTFAFPIGSQRIITWQTTVLAVGTGMAAAIIGVLWPVRAIIAGPLEPTVDPVENRRSWTTARLLAGLGCLAITTYTLVGNTRATVVGNVTLVLALVCLLPFLFDFGVALFERLSNLMDDVGSALAVSELRTPQTRVRSLAIAATAALAVFGTVEFGGTETNLTRGSGRFDTRDGFKCESVGRADGWLQLADDRPISSGRHEHPGFAARSASVVGLPRQLSGLGRTPDLGHRTSAQHRTPGPLRRASERHTNHGDGAGPRRRLGGALAEPCHRTSPPHRGAVHVPIATARDPDARGRDNEPRMAAGHDHHERR